MNRGSSFNVLGDRARPILVTGGAGFIGCNVTKRLLDEGRRVIVLDNLSRGEVQQNLDWLREGAPPGLEIVIADVCDRAAIREAVKGTSHVFHFAAQVAVTTSLSDPLHDFEVNARGTLNVLEAIRLCEEPPVLLYTSTNKVYGALDDVELSASEKRYAPTSEALRTRGISEARSLDFHSPYGCSKGAADQYVLDHARSYGLPSCVFRMSCIYGPRQFGTEDQGWVAHFLIRAGRGEPLSIYGDGKQVRDVLFVDDLVDAFALAAKNIDRTRGRAFNIGGGPGNTTSLLELIGQIEELERRDVRLSFSDWRTGDQRYYVSDTSRFTAATGWLPKVGVREGVTRLHAWLTSSSGGLP